METDKSREQEVVEAIKKSAKDGRMACAEVMSISDKYNYPRNKMADLLTKNQIKIKECQLGCFK